MLEPFVDGTLAALRSGAPPTPIGVTVLLRVFAATGREEVGEAVGRALAAAAAAVNARHAPPVRETAEWLRTYAEAARLTDDDRMAEAATIAAIAVQHAWRPDGADTIADRAAAVEAVLRACGAIDARRFAPPAIDELEQIVGRRYVPGEGLRGCSAGETVAVALALLAAFDTTGRLAYPMLAEELMRAVRDEVVAAPPVVRCAAARVFVRLAALHDDDGYRATAVLVRGADYRRDSAALLASVSGECRSPEDAAAYALALTECGERS